MSRGVLRLVGIALVLATLVACAGASVGVGVRRGYPRYYYGRGPFWGYGGYVPVDPCPGGDCAGIDRPEAVPLPMPEPDYPDMGMPDFGGGMDMGGMDMGGFDF